MCARYLSVSIFLSELEESQRRAKGTSLRESALRNLGDGAPRQRAVCPVFP